MFSYVSILSKQGLCVFVSVHLENAHACKVIIIWLELTKKIRALSYGAKYPFKILYSMVFILYCYYYN
jgi:hypothetical protein